MYAVITGDLVKSRKIRNEDVEFVIASLKDCFLEINRLLLNGKGKFTYEDIVARDKTSLDIFWLRDDNMLDLENLPEPDVLAQEIIENIQAALDSFKEVALKLEE